MDNIPTLNEQFIWIFVLFILSALALVYSKKKELFKPEEIPTPAISLKTTSLFFFVYLALAFFVIPKFFFLFRSLFTKSPIQTLSLLQLFFMTLVSGFFLIYIKTKKIPFFQKIDSKLDAIIVTCQYILVILPIVSLIGQISDTILYYFYNVESYEQVAVAFLKQALNDKLALVYTMISIVIFAPLTEEILFRGVLLNFFRKRWGTWPSILISGIAFSLFHFSVGQGLGNISLLAALGFFGIALGIIYTRFGNLIYPILVHASFNFISSIRILFFDS
jgi:hypothetical protein